MLSLVGFYFGNEPDFVAPGDSYKPHAMTIIYLFFAIAMTTYEIMNHFQRKVDEMNEKFALIGKQSSFLMHEIKSPLNRVVANAQAELSGEVIADILNDSQKISGLVSSIESLIHDTSALTKTFQKFDLAEVKSMIEKDYGPYILSMNIDYDFSQFKGSFYGNKYLIYQLIKNLMMNAIEAIGYRTDIQSFINLETSLDRNHLVIKITNTNSTISPKIMKLIFEPHFTTKSNGTNKGLGLTLGKSIVEAHFGKISVYSENNLTTFEVILPDYSESAVTV